MLEKILRTTERLIPRPLYRAGQPVYHFLLATLGALFYRFPGKRIKVIAITGTKGKTTVTELVNAIFEEAGYTTALAGTLRVKVAEHSKPNLRKMTMPGRFFIQRFLRDAVLQGCGYAILEMTSEAAKQFRHKFLFLDALIITNIAPEHIESHGSYEKYLGAKLSIARELERSQKNNRAIIVNGDDKEACEFLAIKVPRRIKYALSDSEPFDSNPHMSHIIWRGMKITLRIPGIFNIYNALSAAAGAESQNVDATTIKRALEKFAGVRGRMEEIHDVLEVIGRTGRQNFSVIVDYAHTKESLESAYGTYPNARKICVLGSTGGGRDKWKRKEMGAVADKHCERIFLTNEDPYDEDARQIVENVAEGIKNASYEIIIDRRTAIGAALRAAQPGDVVFITGKGTDPYIMEAHGKKTPWDDATVAREELQKLLSKK